MSVYNHKPDRFLGHLHKTPVGDLSSNLMCAGYELNCWRCEGFAFHLAEWLPEYALPEEELSVNHANSLQKINQAAIRVYTSAKHEKRGEAGEIALHAVCRDFFGTIPISPRVFYKSASNDVVKAFDMVHARLPNEQSVEIWLGESKLYKEQGGAVADAIQSIRHHIDAGFLSSEKLLIGPQIPKNIPRYDEVSRVFNRNTSIDVFMKGAVFVVGILCDSESAKKAKQWDEEYLKDSAAELKTISDKFVASGLPGMVRMVLVYIPLATKEGLVTAFDKRLKGLQ